MSVRYFIREVLMSPEPPELHERRDVWLPDGVDGTNIGSYVQRVYGDAKMPAWTSTANVERVQIGWTYDAEPVNGRETELIVVPMFLDDGTLEERMVFESAAEMRQFAAELSSDHSLKVVTLPAQEWAGPVHRSALAKPGRTDHASGV